MIKIEFDIELSSKELENDMIDIEYQLKKWIKNYIYWPEEFIVACYNSQNKNFNIYFYNHLSLYYYSSWVICIRYIHECSLILIINKDNNWIEYKLNSIDEFTDKLYWHIRDKMEDIDILIYPDRQLQEYVIENNPLLIIKIHNLDKDLKSKYSNLFEINNIGLI